MKGYEGSRRKYLALEKSERIIFRMGMDFYNLLHL